jgi:hypothetical protein
MKGKLSIVIVVLLAVLATASFMYLSALAAPQAPAARVTFTKTASDETPTIGDIFTFTLRFNSMPTETQPINIRVTDSNPESAYLEIITDSITGGAIYSPTIDGIVWENTLEPAGTQPHTVTFMVRVTALPTVTLPVGLPGFPITNIALMVDTAVPGSLPDTRAVATIYLQPHLNFLPITFKGFQSVR